MASAVIMMGVSAVVNALAFTGGNALFGMLNKSGAADEAKRHNAAVEKLNQEQAEYNIKRSKNIDWLQTETSRKQEATNEIYSVNSAFDTYKKLFGGDDKSIEQKLPHPNLKPPTLDYTPSEEQKKYEQLFIAGGTAASVAGALILVK